MGLTAQRLFSSLCLLGPVFASYPKIAGYAPGSDVQSHNKLDLDQQEIEKYLKLSPFATYVTKAKAIYEKGANSGARAELTVAALSVALAKGTEVHQTTSQARGFVYKAYGTGATTVKVTYDATSAAACIDNADATNMVTTKCFKTSEEVKIVNPVGTLGTPTQVTNTYRNFKGFSTGVEAKFLAMTADRQQIFNKFKSYYSGDGAYANSYVQAAFDGTGVWAGKDETARTEGIKKGIAFMNNWMYVIREFEDAIWDCKIGNKLNNMDAVHAWDEGVAFYTGSLEGVNIDGKQQGSCTANPSTGCMNHALADKRCIDYKTCDGADNSGPSTVNKELFSLFAQGRDEILGNRCDNAVPHLSKIVSQMTVPLVQGALRYAYKVAKLSGASKEKAEGAVFAAAVLPLVHSCSAGDAKTISDNMKIDSANPMQAGFAKVKGAFESTYKCLGITCKDVGGLLQTAPDYYADFQPCKDAEDTHTTSFAMPSRSISMLLACVASAVVSW